EKILPYATAFDRSALVSILKKAKYRVSEAKDGPSALESLQNEISDLILLKCQMPVVDGVETCRRIKAEEAFRNIPVIFTTHATDHESIAGGYASGGADHVTRPFIAQEVLARVRAHLNLGRLQQEVQEETGRYRALESAMFLGILIHDNGIILEVNDTLADMTDHTPEECLGRHIFEFIDPSDHDRVKKALERAEGETRNVIEGVKRDGSRFPMEVQGKTIQYQGRQARVNVIRDLSEQRRMENENVALRAGLDDRDHLGGLVGKSLPMRRVYNRIVQAAASNDTTVIYGETGTGKELAARIIFELSPRLKGSFVTVNCGAVQETIFESMFFGHKKGAFTGADTSAPGFFDRARGGFLFLDEVGEFTSSMQAKLLRVLQDGEFTPLGRCTPRTADARIICATNRPLMDLVKSGRIREDFFHRIHVIPIEMPPLRNHKEDIGLLTDHFLQLSAGPGKYYPQLPDDLMERFMAYDWPGNVRELFNELRRYLATGEITLDQKFSNPTDSSKNPGNHTYKERVENFERKILTEALSRHSGNRSRVSQTLGIPRKTLQRKIKKYNL
ncbi:sigma 54-interacting transcriptional regulator, partial [Thermodesulfobacteriota bacterium]